MRTLILALLVFACIIPASAQNWLENGDFTDGITHWRGNGRSPADMSSDNPFDKPDPFLSKGLIVPLRHKDWDKIAQDFSGKGTHGVMTITYMVAPDLAFSSLQEDYENIPDQLHYDGWVPFNIRPGNFIVFLADFGTSHGTYWKIKPKMGSAEPQTVRLQLSGLTPFSDKTITLGFPPGSGNLVILNIALTDN